MRPEACVQGLLGPPPNGELARASTKGPGRMRWGCHLCPVTQTSVSRQDGLALSLSQMV